MVPPPPPPPPPPPLPSPRPLHPSRQWQACDSVRQCWQQQWYGFSWDRWRRTMHVLKAWHELAEKVEGGQASPKKRLPACLTTWPPSLGYSLPFYSCSAMSLPAIQFLPALQSQTSLSACHALHTYDANSSAAHFAFKTCCACLVYSSIGVLHT